MKTKIENGIEYTLKNDIWYPTFKMKEDGIQLGKYGMMRKDFLEKYRQTLYDQLALAGNLYAHCKEVEDRAKIWKGKIVKRCIAGGFEIQRAYEIANEVISNELIYV